MVENLLNRGQIDFLNVNPEAKEYWTGKMSKDLSATNICYDFNETCKHTVEISSREIDINSELIKKINHVTGNDNFLLYTILMATLNICLYHYTKKPTIVVGSPALKTKENIHSENDSLIIVNEIDCSNSFRQLLTLIRSSLLEAYKYQDFPIKNLISELELECATSAEKVPFSIMLELTDIHKNMDNTKNDITLSFKKQAEKVCGNVFYNCCLYRQDTIEEIIKCFIQILEIGLNDTNITISELTKVLENSKAKQWIGSNEEEKALTPIKELLVENFKKILNINSVDTSVSFFDIGGHSLLVTQLIFTLNKELNTNLTTIDVYTAPSVDLLAKRVEYNLKKSNKA